MPSSPRLGNASGAGSGRQSTCCARLRHRWGLSGIALRAGSALSLSGLRVYQPVPSPKQYPTDLDFAEAVAAVGNPQLARCLEMVVQEFERRGIYHLALQQLVDRVARRNLALDGKR